jgi:hypothetical protein
MSGKDDEIRFNDTRGRLNDISSEERKRTPDSMSGEEDKIDCMSEEEDKIRFHIRRGR